MRLLRSAGAIGLAKIVYDQARKPQNQARIRALVQKVQASRSGAPGRAGAPRSRPPAR
jgi:hypothetical protein